ncbi:hypothetical protein GCK72_023855 [Caenorhabditis remanei]|uniref:C2H2-type domain-containing protein n=2 Tax=Caenorhabditis remanei TaxID=31234 RepID=A0A6A5FXV1_CAERE|nr:hypothetical protein GCK72_023855 [Caenorhabditis remanei]KAF1747393.1 hypothetical protein GCK72_023855 [Caenorhabditis remanei]
MQKSFSEKVLYAHDAHIKYIEELEEEAELQRIEEIEANQLEELRTGGFVPPENEISEYSDNPNLHMFALNALQSEIFALINDLSAIEESFIEAQVLDFVVPSAMQSNHKHERVHTGIIKFECKVCNFRANRFTTMEDHKNNEQGYICPICQERACEYSDIKHHVFESHGEYLAVDEPIGFVDSASSWMFFKGE